MPTAVVAVHVTAIIVAVHAPAIAVVHVFVLAVVGTAVAERVRLPAANGMNGGTGVSNCTHTSTSRYSNVSCIIVADPGEGAGMISFRAVAQAICRFILACDNNNVASMACRRNKNTSC